MTARCAEPVEYVEQMFRAMCENKGQRAKVEGRWAEGDRGAKQPLKVAVGVVGFAVYVKLIWWDCGQ
jgi:hypothetical protein